MKSEVKVKKESAPAKAKGGKRTGRPVKNGSERQKRLAAKAARIKSGEVIKRGRPALDVKEIEARMAVKAANKATNKAVKAAVKAEKAKPKLEDFGIAIAPTFIGTEA
jgi:3-oxoacyl-[acyl-carrier-protein] synthase III